MLELLSVSNSPLDLLDPKSFITRSKIETLHVLDGLNSGENNSLLST